MSGQSREVLVIGAGIAGLTAARDLAIDGYDVAVPRRASALVGASGLPTISACPPIWEHPGSTALKTIQLHGSPGGTLSQSSAPTSPV